MCGNNTGAAGAAGLAEALRQNSSLTELDLSRNIIGDAGVAGLAEALKQNSSLKELDLSRNIIGDAGAAGLAEALRENSSTRANLFGNNISKAVSSEFHMEHGDRFFFNSTSIF